MTEYSLPVFTFNPCVFFTGTDAEQNDAEKQIEAWERAARDIITGTDASEYLFTSDIERAKDKRLIVHRSTRPGIMYQLSYFDYKGAIMHENADSISEAVSKLLHACSYHNNIAFNRAI